MMEALITIESLQKAYQPGKPVLHDVSLTFRPGEFAVLLGLSGTGKSTFLRCLNRMIAPTAGQILVPRTVIVPGSSGYLDVALARGGELRLWRRKVGMIFQAFNLVKRLSVLDNVLAGSLGYAGLFSGAFRRFSASDRARALFNLERVDLLEQAYQRADTLSGGQQQRVAIARALMQRPALILADEPVASLDPKLSVQILELLRRIAREDGLTVIVSLHVVELARTYGDRILGFSGGRVVFDGPSTALDESAIERIYHREGHENAPHAKIGTS